MEIIVEIRAKFTRDEFEFSRHALDRTILRMIRIQEIREAIEHCELVEDYPDDKYGPSCLLLGFTQGQRALHIQCSYPTRPLVKIITVYEPDPAEWLEWKFRRS